MQDDQSVFERIWLSFLTYNGTDMMFVLLGEKWHLLDLQSWGTGFETSS